MRAPAGELASIGLADSDQALAQIGAEAAVIAIDREWESYQPAVELASHVGADIKGMLRELGSAQPSSRARVLPLGGEPGPVWVVCVGIRDELPAPMSYRLAGMEAAEALGDASSIAVCVPTAADGRERACALVEGLLLGRRSSDPPDDPDRTIPEADGQQTDVRRSLLIASATNWCRQLVNQSSSELTPRRLAEIAGRMAASTGLESRIWSAEELQAERFGAILAVGRGASNPPCMIEIRMGTGSGPTIVLVGKGVTCDTGGLQIKTADHEWLWADMGGAAAILAATWASAQLGLDVDLRVLIPCVENMPGPGAYRPGDVITHRDGTTTEVVHTDGEGRLVLGDAIAYAGEDHPAAIIDVATLTDDVALGPQLWALFGDDEALTSALLRAGSDAGEPGWRLPLWPGYRNVMTSDCADRTNQGSLSAGWVGGTIVAGLFLAQFARNVPWAHIDIAGSSFRAAPTPPWPRGATGSGTGALIRFLELHAAGEAGVR